MAQQETNIRFPDLKYPEHILWNEGRTRTFYEVDPKAGLRDPRGSIPRLVHGPQGAQEQAIV